MVVRDRMSFDERRGQIVEAFWSALQKRPFAELSLEMLAGDAGSEGQGHLAAGSNMAGLADMTDLACVAVAMVDEQALAEIADDFQDAGDALARRSIPCRQSNP